MITKEEILARARALKDKAACKGTLEKFTAELRSFLDRYGASSVIELPSETYPFLMRFFLRNGIKRSVLFPPSVPSR